MWTLFVVTLLGDIDDAKVTRYDTYKTESACNADIEFLHKKFEEAEFAFCHYEKIVKQDTKQEKKDNK